MTVELRPCPFCGGAAAIIAWQDEELWSHAIVEWQKAHCTECECEGISSCPGYEQDTVQAWNTRAPQWLPIESAPADGTRVLLWDTAKGGYAITGAWVVGSANDHETFTHWQPLPAPPAVKP